MLTRLVESAGVDYAQWRALVRAYVMLDYSALLGAYGPVAARRAARHLLLQWLFFGLFGTMPALAIAFARDPFFAATVMVTVTSSLVAVFMLMQAATLVAPDDYAVIGFRPVSSTTYFAARVAGLLTHTAEIGVLTGYPSVVAFLIRSGGSLRVTGAAIAAIGASAVVTTLSVVALYGWLQRFLPAARLQRVVAITAFLGLLLIFGADFLGFYASVDIDAGGTMHVNVDQTLAKNAWTLLYPGAWFAVYPEIARGAAGTFEWAGGALSAMLMVALAATFRGRISAGYADRIAHATTTTANVVRADPAWRLLINERRALAVLVRHLIRTDMTLQVGILMQVAVGVVVGAFVASEHLPLDPFPGGGRYSSTGALFLLFLLPRNIRQDLVVSRFSRASWMFFSTPADRGRLVTGMRDLIAILVLPLLFLGVSGFFTYAYGHVGHALADAAVLCSASYVILQIDAMFDPRLPFSMPVIDRRGGLVPRGSWRVFFGCLVVYELFDLSRDVLYRNGWLLAGGALAIAALIVSLDRLTLARVAAKIQSAEYFE